MAGRRLPLVGNNMSDGGSGYLSTSKHVQMTPFLFRRYFSGLKEKATHVSDR